MRFVHRRAINPIPLSNGLSEERVDESGRPWAETGVGLTNRLIHGRVIRNSIQDKNLVQADSEDFPDRFVDSLFWTTG